MRHYVYQLVPNGPATSAYRYYTGAIIAARTLEQALRTHPASSERNRIRWSERDQVWMSHFDDGTVRPYINTAWPDHPSKVAGLKIAEMLDPVDSPDARVVLAAQNAA
ncbi:hypothetical protein [Microvirga massiliensis]|uniref:hypothetical protein n=1 Tax=Microvirga massiliensis TaxID=1033741 RepID=UPI00062BD2B6|nr:hypothetical protein [Microvirga massiliensis]